MYGKDTDLIFPLRVLPSLRGLRGAEWSSLVDRIQAAPEAEVEALAFSLMMVRLASCLTCTADSFRAMRGCTQCAGLAVRRYKGSDADLVALFESACEEVAGHLGGGGIGCLPGGIEEVEVHYDWQG